MINFLDDPDKRNRIIRMIEEDIRDNYRDDTTLNKNLSFLCNGLYDFIIAKYNQYSNEYELINDYLKSTKILYDGTEEFSNLFTIQLILHATHGAQMDELNKDFISSISSRKRVNNSVHEDIYMPSCGSVSSYGGSHC